MTVGQLVRVPAGVEVRSTNPRRREFVVRRSYVVTVVAVDGEDVVWRAGAYEARAPQRVMLDGSRPWPGDAGTDLRRVASWVMRHQGALAREIADGVGLGVTPACAHLSRLIERGVVQRFEADERWRYWMDADARDWVAELERV